MMTLIVLISKRLFIVPSQVQTKDVYKKKYLLRLSRIFFLTIFTFEICTTILKIPTSLLKKVHYYINNSKYLPRLFSSKAMLTIQVQYHLVLEFSPAIKLWGKSTNIRMRIQGLRSYISTQFKPYMMQFLSVFYSST